VALVDHLDGMFSPVASSLTHHLLSVLPLTNVKQEGARPRPVRFNGEPGGERGIQLWYDGPEL
jgi:hypothetical protein